MIEGGHEWDVRRADERYKLVARPGISVTEDELAEYASQASDVGLPEYWFRIGPLGDVSIPLGPRKVRGVSLETALVAIKDLWAMRHYVGFPHLIEGWRNGPQVESAFAELRCIAFLRSAESHLSMEFGPFVASGERGSRADILWNTKRGQFLVEAKSLHPAESQLASAMHRMIGEAAEVLSPQRERLSGYRVDVVCSASGKNFPALLLRVAAELDLDGGNPRVGVDVGREYVRATLRSRSEAPDAGGPCMRASSAKVGPTPTQLHPVAGSECWLTLSLLLGPKLHHAIRGILLKARHQLRGARKPAIIYLETDHMDPTVAYIMRIMSQAEYATIPLVIASDGHRAHLVRRQVCDPIGDSLDATLAVLAYPE